MILKLKKSENKKALKYIAYGTDKKKYEFQVKDDNSVAYNRKKADFHIEDNDGFTYVVWNNKKYPVEVIEKNQNRYHILMNGLSYHFSIETPISYKRKKFLEKRKSESKVENVIAPMPGKIIDILVEPNTDINECEPVLILEAMKMQNEIVAGVSGKIISINVKKEDTVMKDDILMEIEK